MCHTEWRLYSITYSSDDIITGVASYTWFGSRNLGDKLGKGYALIKQDR